MHDKHQEKLINLRNEHILDIISEEEEKIEDLHKRSSDGIHDSFG